MAFKTFAAIGIAGTLALGAPWLIGQQVEAGFREALAEAPAHTPYPVTLVRYERGLLSARAETRHVIALAPEAGATAADGDGQPVDAPAREQVVVLQHAISHGPRLDGLRWARIVTTLRLEGEADAWLRTLFGAAEPLTVTVDAGLAGGYRGRIASPAATATDLRWSGLDGDFRLDGEHFAGQLISEGLAGVGGGFALGPVRASADLTAVAGTVWTGRIDSTVASISSRGPEGGLTLTGLHIESDTVDTGGSLRSSNRIGLERLHGGPLDLETLRLAFVVDALPTRAMAELNTAANRQALAAAAGRDAAPELAAIRAALSALAAGRPQLAVEELSFVTDAGPFRFSGLARYVGDAELDDFSPVTDLEASARIDAPMALLAALLRSQAGDAADAEPAQVDARVQATLAGLVGQGLLDVADGRGRSAVEFKAGALTVNGRPLGAPPI